MGFSMVGTVTAVLMLFPSIIFFIKFPPKNVPSDIKDAPTFFTILEKIGQASCFALMIASNDYFKLDNINIFMILMIICILIYYGIWIRYVVQGQEFYLIWKPFLFIPIPLAVFPVCAFGFAALWGKYIWLGIATVILAIGHCAVTWNSYKQVNEHNVKMS